MIHITRGVERDLITDLTALSGYRQARWRSVILSGLAGTGKTALARAVVDDGTVQRAFRDGIAWIDGRREPDEEITRLCLALGLQRTPGENWVACWRRWAGVEERRLLLVIDDAIAPEALPPFIAGLGPQVVTLITTQQVPTIQAEVERWLPTNTVTTVELSGLTPIEGRQLFEAVLLRALNDDEWTSVSEIGELVGWHPEALRLAAIEGRTIGWLGQLAELWAGRMPWPELRRWIERPYASLSLRGRPHLWAIMQRGGSVAGFTTAEAAECWQVENTIAARQLWILQRCGMVTESDAVGSDAPRWHVHPLVSLALRDAAG